MYLSRLTLRDEVSATSLFWKIFANPYAVHQALWQAFSDSHERERDFLYRVEELGRKPVIYTVSEREPDKENKLWCTEIKSYSPNIVNGQSLAFSLRVNPVDTIKKDRMQDDIQSWQANRTAKGLKDKAVTKKRVRHDVVMDAKKKMGWQNMPVQNRPSMAQLIQKTGFGWLQKRSRENGFVVEDKKVRVDGYMQHCFLKKSKNIKLSTLELNGVLKVENTEDFLRMLYGGLGPAKGFGCGLMLVKKI